MIVCETCYTPLDACRKEIDIGLRRRGVETGCWVMMRGVGKLGGGGGCIWIEGGKEGFGMIDLFC